MLVKISKLIMVRVNNLLVAYVVLVLIVRLNLGNIVTCLTNKNIVFL